MEKRVETLEAEVNSLKKYIESMDPLYKEELETQSESVNPVNKNCKMSIAMPVYCEHDIYNALQEYTKFQVDEDLESIAPGFFEINILLNTPNKNIPFDEKTESEVKRFQEDNPEYAINFFKKQFSFEGRIKMGTIFKYITDICAMRSQNDNVIIRTSGADNEGLNPHLINKTFEEFEKNEKLGALANEYKYKKELMEKIPLLHFIDTLSKASTRIVERGKTFNGAFSFRVGVYCDVGGFNPDYFIAEDVNLSRKIIKFLVKKGGEFKRSGMIESYYSPRRLLTSLMTGEPSLNRYRKFGELNHEDKIRTLEHPKNIPPDPILNVNSLQSDVFPEKFKFTAEHLVRELSTHFASRVKMAFKQKRFTKSKDLEERKKLSIDLTRQIFKKIFYAIGMSFDYEIDDDLFEVKLDEDGNSGLYPKRGHEESVVAVKNIDSIVELLRHRKFIKHDNLESLREKVRKMKTQEKN